MTRLVSLCLLLDPCSVVAQVGQEWPDDGFLERLTVPISEALETCAIPLEVLEPGVVELRCNVVANDRVPLTQDSTIHVVKYERWVRYETFSRLDSMFVNDVVLFEAERPGRDATAIWHRVGFHNYVGGIEWAQTESSILFQVFNCVRGTGGCQEEILVRSVEGWGVVVLSFIDELNAHLPDGYRLHKGRQVDLETFDFEQPIAKAGDANCCPSGLMKGRLRLEGRTLRLDTITDVQAPRVGFLPKGT